MNQLSTQSETRQRVIQSAEYLFATKGYDATSIREITKGAEANTAAVNYYFTDKQNLYTTVFLYRLKEMREYRITAMRNIMDQSGGALTVELICETFARAFLAPLAEEKESQILIQLFMREMMDPKLPSDMFLKEMAQPMHQILHQALTTIHSELQPNHTFMCLHSLVAQLIHFVQMRELIFNQDATTSPKINEQAMLEHVIRFTAAGIKHYTNATQSTETQTINDNREESS